MCQNCLEKKDINGDITIGNIETKKPAQSQGVLMAKKMKSALIKSQILAWSEWNQNLSRKAEKILVFWLFCHNTPKCAVFSKIQLCTLCTQLLRLHFLLMPLFPI